MCRAQSQNRTEVTPSRGRQRVVRIMSTIFPLNRKNMIQMVSPKGVECRLQFNIIACPGGLRFPNSGMSSLEDSQQINRLTRENYKNNYSLRKLSWAHVAHGYVIIQLKPFSVRRKSVSGVWATPIALTPTHLSSGQETLPSNLRPREGGLWLFSSSQPTVSETPFCFVQREALRFCL